MKLLILFFYIILFSAGTYCQQITCADSSYRIRYAFDGEGTIFTSNSPDTIGKNYFCGQYQFGQTPGLALMKTTWGDSIIWAKKIFSNGIPLDCTNSSTAPNGTLILTGNYGGAQGNKPELLICKADTNGVVFWIKRYSYSQNHLNFDTYPKHILITNNAIYLNIILNNIYSVVAKLDLDGNIIWSTAFSMKPLPSGQQTNTFIVGAPVLYNNAVIIYGNSGISINNSPGITTITKLNESDGSFIESIGDKIVTNTTIKGTLAQHINYNNDKTFTLSGYTIFDNFGTITNSSDVFYSLLDTNFNNIKSYYFKNPFLDGTQIFDFNKTNHHALLANDGRFGKGNEKYFFTFDKDYNIIRSRKFLIPNYLPVNYGMKLDDKQNIHFIFQGIENAKLVTEYARISNLAPSGTLGCFGKDTSILTRIPFTLTKTPFVWDNIQSNVITSNNVPYTEDTAIVTKELVCKIVSRCDSVHINGPASTCVGSPVRYTVSKNNGCFKNLDWAIDTAFANIINTEGDSAITISFKKSFSGYIHAALTDCVVKDSFLVKAVTPVPRSLINHTDSVLCPGKTLLLTANSGFTNYLWQGNTTGTQFTISSPGVYTLTANDSCGTLKKDSITVIATDTSFTVTPATQTICLYDTAFIQLPADISNISWQPFTNALLRNTSLVTYPSQTTLYTITAQRQPNCTFSKTAEVIIKICPQTVFIPNAFTPNKNGVNDIFKPIISQPVAFYQFVIYNRYGQIIFTSNNQYTGWDGTFKTKPQPMGGYMYQCNYRFAGKTQQMLKGFFILVR